MVLIGDIAMVHCEVRWVGAILGILNMVYSSISSPTLFAFLTSVFSLSPLISVLILSVIVAILSASAATASSIHLLHVL